jgi:hypothetical protein
MLEKPSQVALIIYLTFAFDPYHPQSPLVVFVSDILNFRIASIVAFMIENVALMQLR